MELLVEHLVGMLRDFPGHLLPIPEAEAVETVKAAIFKSMDICDDYIAQIEATTEFVHKNLKDHLFIC